MPSQKMLTVTEVAQMTGLPKRDVQKRCKKGTLKAKKKGEKWTIPESEALALCIDLQRAYDPPDLEREPSEEEQELTTPPSSDLALADPNELLRERGLE